MEENDKDDVEMTSTKTSGEIVTYGDNPDIAFFFPNNGGAIVMAEKLLLAHSSVIFRKHITAKNVENETGKARRIIYITDIPFEIFSSVIKFLYDGDIKIYEENYQQVLYMGKKYFIGDLIQKVINFLHKFIKAENLPVHFEFIDKFDIPTLRDRIKKICVSHPLEVMQRLTKSEPHKKILQIILESPYLPCTEFDIYKAIVQIFSENLDNDVFDVPKHMREELGKLIFLIRFPTMTAKEIISCVAYPSFLTDEEVVDFLLWIEEKAFSKSLQFFSTQPRRKKCSCHSCRNKNKLKNKSR